MKESDTSWFVGSAFVVAMASSLCCILPVLSVALGLSAFGAASMFETLRPYLLILAFSAVGFSFYQTYFRREKCKEGEACAAKPIGRFNQIVLWMATIGIAGFALFPYYSGYIVSALDKPQPASEVNQVAETENVPNSNETEKVVKEVESQARKTIVIAVEGMTCESCADHIGIALKRIKGVYSAEASYPNKNVTAVYNPKQVTVERIKQGIRDAGYDPK